VYHTHNLLKSFKLKILAQMGRRRLVKLHRPCTWRWGVWRGFWWWRKRRRRWRQWRVSWVHGPERLLQSGDVPSFSMY